MTGSRRCIGPQEQCCMCSSVLGLRPWAFSVGLLFEEEFLSYLWLSPLPVPCPSFLQGSLKSYSVVRRGGGWVPPPLERRLPHMPVWHNVLLGNTMSLTSLPGLAEAGSHAVGGPSGGGGNTPAALGALSAHVEVGLFGKGGGYTVVV